MGLPDRKDVLDGLDAVDTEIDRLEGLASAAGAGVLPDLRRGFLAPRKGLERLRLRLTKLLEQLPDPVADDETVDEFEEATPSEEEAAEVTARPPLVNGATAPTPAKRPVGRPRKTTTEEK